MNNIRREIVERLGVVEEMEAALHVALLRELARGQPVTTERLAKSLNWTTGEAVLVLEQLPGGTIEYDCQGRLIGYGITRRETPHAFVVNDQPLYAWCALDALMFPTVIGERAQVQSRCPHTNTPVTLTVTPQEVLSLQPEDAVISLVSVAAEGDIRSAFCCDVHFFASRQAGEAWCRDRPRANIVSVQEGFELGQQIAHLMLDRARSH
ncbi:organomercurial lyase MerB [uncultured Salinisphaera sp.]|jgi:alkylmercury lyase|uniref:organomercurial lyase MerB n=1 Tax=uncultured Salinisphaera sp. TaxID=359372 RepID=UPI0032B1B3F1|tara:strand:- start:6 stop:632 length:627 start_codon:yes stop_codon:yes gene_type:complete